MLKWSKDTPKAVLCKASQWLTTPICLLTMTKYVNDMTTWPSIEYIFGYFVTRPGVHMQQELLQMDAYNFFQVGYVRTVLPFQFGPGKCMFVLKARVIPSQSDS